MYEWTMPHDIVRLPHCVPPAPSCSYDRIRCSKNFQWSPPMRTFFRCSAVLILFTSILGWSQAKTEPQAPKKIVVLKAAQIFDSRAGKYMSGQVVVIEGDRVQQIIPVAGFN